MKYLSLFSGIGGFEYGLEQSKYEFECIGFSEIDKYAKSIYKKNYPNHIDLGDATEIRTEELEDFDLLVGGFPCQAFSLSGKRKGFDDTRGTLFFEIARILKAKKPRYFLLENVKGLLSHDKGRTFKKILGVLSELGYDVEWEVLNSKSVGGVPQNRERLYIKGYFRAKCGCEILSQKRSGRETSVQELITHHFNRQVQKRVHSVDYDELSSFLRDAKKQANVTINDIVEVVDKPKSEVEHWFRKDEFFSPPPSDVWLSLKQFLGIESDKYDDFMLEFEWVDGVYDQDKRAYDVDGVSSTLTTTSESLIVDGLCGDALQEDGLRVMLDEEHQIKIVDNTSPSNHWASDVFDVDGISRSITATNWKHPLKIKLKTNNQNNDKDQVCNSFDCETVDRDFRVRKLTPLECERLQAFPDYWTLYGEDNEVISDTQRYKCLGNAVTTTVVTFIADNMFKEYYESLE